MPRMPRVKLLALDMATGPMLVTPRSTGMLVVEGTFW